MPRPLTHGTADLGAVRLHYVEAGSGPVLVLLHGWPQTWYSWRHVIDGLSDSFRVIAPDLRGLGDSSRPANGYDKKTIASDVERLLRERLGIDSFFLAGHDWGGGVAFALAARYPGSVRKLAILDVSIPGDGADYFSQGGKRWHHAFHQTRNLPEALVHDREALYLGWFYTNYGARADIFSKEDIAEYLRTYTQPGAMKAGFEYYRAIPQDIADNEESLRAGKLAMPVLALGGDSSWGRGPQVLESLQRVATDVRGGVIPDCGHWIPEEQPETVVRDFRGFFQR